MSKSPQIKISKVSKQKGTVGYKGTWPIRGRGLGCTPPSINRTMEGEFQVKKSSGGLWELSNNKKQFWYKSEKDMKKFLEDWGLNPAEYMHD